MFVRSECTLCNLTEIVIILNVHLSKERFSLPSDLYFET